jgi:PAS domain S-box-containing protein
MNDLSTPRDPAERHTALTPSAGAGDPAPVGRTSGTEVHNSEADSAINQRLFETSLDLILIVDRYGTILRASPSAEKCLGYRPEDLFGESAAKLLYAEDLEHTRNEMRLARRGGKMRNFDCRYVHRDGHIVTLAWTGVWSEHQQQYFFIGRDMTERLKLEQQLRQSQRMEAIGQLSGGVAHDFNNILTVIIGMNEVLASAVAQQPQLAELCKSIDAAAERGVKLTQRMLAFARKQPLEASILDLNDIIARMAAVLRQTLGEHIRVETALAPDLWRTKADASRLEDAILNLAVNARDAMPKGGRLLLETSNVFLDDQYAQDHAEVAPGDYVAVYVADSGSGMTPEVIEKAFEPFFTTKEVGRGTGLGLSMVYGFAKQSGGHIKIYSELGHGTSIKLYLPRIAEAVKTAGASGPAAAPAAASGRETILVVEDDAAVRAVAVATLQSAGYTVLQAPDGPAGLEVLRSSQAIDLLFTDLVMPNGVSGQDLLRMARDLRPGLKAIFTSGYSEQFVRGREDTDRGVPLLAKPYRRQQLSDMIRSVLDGAVTSKSIGQGLPTLT